MTPGQRNKKTPSSAHESVDLSTDPWSALRRFTPARIGLGRSGASMPTEHVLELGFAHAAARDAIHRPLDVSTLVKSLENLGFAALPVQSRVSDRGHYLMRPDLGRRLSEDCVERLVAVSSSQQTPDIVFVIADGLSTLAVERYAADLVMETMTCLASRYAVAPVIVAEQSRVAIGDEIAATLGAQLVIMLIGERPGLSSQDSLGAYITYAPQIGTMDSARNCISNIRRQGLPVELAARKLSWFVEQALTRKLTGVGLKDESPALSFRDEFALPGSQT